MTTEKTFAQSWVWPGLSHCVIALLIQGVFATTLAWRSGTDIWAPAFWWRGAALAGVIFALREVWQWRQKDPPVWWQNRAPFDVLTAVLPVLAVAIAMECL